MKSNKIFILAPKNEFSLQQVKQLEKVGTVNFTNNRDEIPLEKLIELVAGSTILGFDPDNMGGFKVSNTRLVHLLTKTPSIKGIALSTTSFWYIDPQFCRKNAIQVTNVPYYSTEAVAEHAIALMLNCAKRIFHYQKRQQNSFPYKPIKGKELSGKILGIIGLGHIGSRVAQLGNAFGMDVVGWNRTPKDIPGVISKSLDKVIATSDFLSINLAKNDETVGIISKKLISFMKHSVIVVNTSNRSLVDEEAMAQALNTGRVDSYAFETEDLKSPPLTDCENAFPIRGFGWFTNESLYRNKQIWIDNIVALATGTQPPNPVIV